MRCKMKKKRTLNYKDSTLQKYGLWILLIAIAIVPLLVRITPIDYPTDQISWVQEDESFYDVYSYVKSNVIIFLGLISFILIGTLVKREKKSFMKDPIIIISSVGILLLLFSTLFSDHSYTAIWGYLERFEGLLVLLSYYSIFILAYKYLWKADTLNTVYKWFFISNLVLSIIGIMQYFGVDPLLSEYMRPFITSIKLQGLTFQTEATVNYTVIGQTLYHYNYVSFFAALSFPIFLTKALYEHNLKFKLLNLLMVLLITFNLLGSSARGGMVGLVVGLIVWFVLNVKEIFRNIKYTVGFVVLLVISFVGFELLSGGFVTSRLSSMFASETINYNIKRVYTNQNIIIVDLENDQLEIEIVTLDENNWQFKSYLNNDAVKPIYDDSNRMIFEEDALDKIQLHLEKFENDKVHMVVDTDGISWPFILENNSLSFRNIYGNYKTLNYSTAFGFEGHERLGSARGYIWSRTLPLIFAKPYLGYGPDVFPLVFPQEDYIGKYYAYGTYNMIVDKPHNIFLQQAMNAGIPNLLVYLSLLSIFIFMGFRSFVLNKFRFDNIYIPAIMTSVISYSVAGFFNDSSVHVAPVYWVLLGIGLALVMRKDKSKII